MLLEKADEMECAVAAILLRVLRGFLRPRAGVPGHAAGEDERGELHGGRLQHRP